ncbi:MAG TPA: tyrosine-type recombinase/integrase, partial [Chloroflexota bacterium]
QRTEARLARDRYQEQGWVFTSRYGNHLLPRWISRHLADVLKGAGLEHLPIHGLRHTFCTLLLKAGASIKDVQEIAGHSRPSVTLNMYFASIPGAGQRVADQAGALFDAPVPSATPSECPGNAPVGDAIVRISDLRARNRVRNRGGQ